MNPLYTRGNTPYPGTPSRGGAGIWDPYLEPLPVQQFLNTLGHTKGFALNTGPNLGPHIGGTPKIGVPKLGSESIVTLMLQTAVNVI